LIEGWLAEYRKYVPLVQKSL